MQVTIIKFGGETTGQSRSHKFVSSAPSSNKSLVHWPNLPLGYR